MTTAQKPTIFLELTPREAAVIYDFVLTADWSRGPYGDDLKAIYDALTGVGSAFRHHEPTLRLSSTDQYIDLNEIYMDE